MKDDGRIIAIGDVHGCAETLKTLIIEKIRPTSSDTLIFLGDLIDRGPKSKEVLDFIFSLENTENNVIRILGNHEEYLIKTWERRQKKHLFADKIERQWFKVGAAATLRSFDVTNVRDIPAYYITKIKEARKLFITNDFVFVHAGLDFTQDDPFLAEDVMTTIRNFSVRREKIGGRRVIHGHMPVNMELIRISIDNQNLGFIDIDNGVNFNKKDFGNLVAYDTTNNEVFVQRNIDRQ